MNASIIGAGLGGLSCGIHLLKKGFQVKIYEKHSRSGGRVNVIEQNGFKIDMGPTLVLMPEILENVFKTAGKKLSDYIRLRPLDPGYRIFFANGQSFDMTNNPSRMIRQVLEYAPGRERSFYAYRRDVEKKFVHSRRAFIEKNFESFWDMVNWESLIGFFHIRPFGNAYQHVYRFFKNHELAIAFSCQTLYLGQSPFKTPSLYNLLAYLEFTYGIWYPEGGMSQIPKALEKLFIDMGGILQFDSEIESIVVQDRKASGIRLKNGTVELSDAVISNRDLPASYYHFVDSKFRRSVTDKKIRNWHYGSSCVLIYLGLKKRIKGLLHHNILISSNFKRSCQEIFERGVFPEEPLLYVCSPTQTDPSLAPEGKEIVYILALAPNLKDSNASPEDITSFCERIFRRIKSNGVDIEQKDIELRHVFTPQDFESSYGSFYGNAFGLAPDFFQSACFRPQSKSKDVKGLYHTGASTHPGGGIPMVLTSGRLVAEQVDADFRDRLSQGKNSNRDSFVGSRS